MTTAELQQWLNAHGAALRVDGDFGPATRAAFIAAFRCRNAKAASAGEVEAIAARLGASGRQLRAVGRVEGGGSGWDRDGQLKTLYERHYAWKRVRIKVPFLSDPVPGGYTIDADHDGINDSWEKLADSAARWGVETALECASLGRFQVMGAHWRTLGYPSVLALAHGLVASEAAHYEFFARFIEKMGLKRALQKVDGQAANCVDFARGYNGSGYAKGGYHVKIAEAWRAG